MFKNIHHSVKAGTIIICAIFASLFLSAICLAEVGRMHIDKKVKTKFEAYQYSSNYNYYFANQDNNPCAVIGLRKDYNVDDILWTETLPGSDDFKKVIDLVKRFPMSSSPSFGAYIMDSKGNTIGEYYSSAGAGVVVDKEKKSLMFTIFMAGTHHN